MIYFVVEGKSDSAKLKSIFKNVQTIETNGSEINKEIINLIKKVSQKNQVIIFTDPDGPGKKIRQKIILKIPNLKHAFIEKEKAIKGKKVGIAQATVKDIIEAVENLVDFKTKSNKTNSWNDFRQLGYIGENDSKEKRKKLCLKIGIPYANGKTLYNWLEMIDYKLTKEENE